MRSVHEGEKRFICGATDLRASKDLETWEAAADGASCGARFAAKGNLEEHVRRVHLRLPGANRAGKRPSATLTPQEKKAKQAQPSALSRLTGAGYGEESGRNIACPEVECAYRFFRTYDLDLHLRTHHGLLDGVRTGEGYVDDGDEAAEREVGRAFAWDVEAELERMASVGGEFWVGGLGRRDVEEGVARDGEGEEEEETIDPVLRYFEMVE